MWAISVLIGVYYTVILGWVLFYIYKAISIFWKGEVPWGTCDDSWTTKPVYCVADKGALGELRNSTLGNSTSGMALEQWETKCLQTASELFYNREVLGQPLVDCSEDIVNYNASTAIEPDQFT